MSDENEGQEATDLSKLGAWTVDQNDLENDVAEKAINDRDQELDLKRLDKTRATLDTHLNELRVLQNRAKDPRVRISVRERTRAQIEQLKNVVIAGLEKELHEIQARIDERRSLGGATAEKKPIETEHEFLIRTGKITPFARSSGFHVQKETVSDTDSEVSDRSSQTEENEEEFVELDKDKDDGDEAFYNRRLSSWINSRKSGRVSRDSSKAEWLMPHPTCPDAILEGNFRVPGEIYSKLFDYQKTGVQWLLELHDQKVGGIVGDEMGLGKTVQIIAYIAGLHHSDMLKKPVLIVCPATVMRQWVQEFHKWWPPLRVAILHSIGSALCGSQVLPVTDQTDEVAELTEKTSRTRAKQLIGRIVSQGHVMVTTYAGLRAYSAYLFPIKFSACVLDEGHKIRNPDSEIALACKQIKTSHRIILSGTPIQNNLTELWSLFDFVFPGRLGTLPVFQSQFSVPISVGGYANATNVQVQTAYKCAVVLRDMISPYLLRRLKTDVAADLPKKSEKVLFCQLTKAQYTAYRTFLKSPELASILSGKRQALFGIDILRKICNHPHLVDKDHILERHGDQYGDPTKSAKQQILKALLEMWKAENRKVLVFCQTRQMLNILESFMRSLKGMCYLRMDGTTPISSRQHLVDSFNGDPQYDVFLLTTRVGGLGVNLTGADRVVIYDPDWNPSTDIQARERAWRLGQRKDVVIYRLMTAGTIEEKIYHRQIFKQFLTNKILKDPKQRRFFKTNDLHDLFTLGSSEENGTETGSMFKHAEKRLRESASKDPHGDDKRKRPDDSEDLTKLLSMQGVAGLEDLDEASSIGNSDSTSSGSSGGSKDSILNNILSEAGVHSTLEHDDIMSSERPDARLVEQEATRVANLAYKALKLSRKAAAAAKLGTPTWTGKFGQAGSPQTRLNPNWKSAMSSSAILKSIESRKQVDSQGLDNHDSGNDGSKNDKQVQLLASMRDYIAKQPDGKAKSAAIVSSCNIYVTGDQQIANVRQMLRQIATWIPQEACWQLKADSREA